MLASSLASLSRASNHQPIVNKILRVPSSKSKLLQWHACLDRGWHFHLSCPVPGWEQVCSSPSSWLCPAPQVGTCHRALPTMLARGLPFCIRHTYFENTLQFFFRTSTAHNWPLCFAQPPSEIKHFTISYNFLPNNPGIPNPLNPVALNQCHAEDTWAVFILHIRKGTAVNYWAQLETEPAQIFR